MNLHPLFAEPAEGDVVPGLKPARLLVEVENGRLDRGGILVFQRAQARSAGGTLDEKAGAGGQNLGAAPV
ncbi:hypothetical protein ACFFOP_15840 [Sinosporangium siamense]|uniref:hypothetical protein n=1 Tax=Sinosporangium siamense TaxID=1367973 RepID=UPI0035E4B557